MNVCGCDGLRRDAAPKKAKSLAAPKDVVATKQSEAALFNLRKTSTVEDIAKGVEVGHAAPARSTPSQGKVGAPAQAAAAPSPSPRTPQSDPREERLIPQSTANILTGGMKKGSREFDEDSSTKGVRNTVIQETKVEQILVDPSPAEFGKKKLIIVGDREKREKAFAMIEKLAARTVSATSLAGSLGSWQGFSDGISALEEDTGGSVAIFDVDNISVQHGAGLTTVHDVAGDMGNVRHKKGAASISQLRRNMQQKKKMQDDRSFREDTGDKSNARPVQRGPEQQSSNVARPVSGPGLLDAPASSREGRKPDEVYKDFEVESKFDDRMKYFIEGCSTMVTNPPMKSVDIDLERNKPPRMWREGKYAAGYPSEAGK